MIKGKIECSNASREKVANCLMKFVISFPSEFKGWAYDKKFFISFELESLSDFKELIRRLKRIRGIRIKYFLR
jgi:hypothetical protein